MRRVCIALILILFSVSVLNHSLILTPTEQTLDNDHTLPSQLLNVERTWTTNVIIVNYNQSLIEETTLLADMPTERTYVTDTVMITHNIEYNVYYADQSYVDELSQVVMDNSINGSDTGTRLNESALVYQKNNPDELQRIFNPRPGRVIDGYAVEDWLEQNPYVTPPELGYTLYLVNFSSLDTAYHDLEHWYDYHPIDPDTGEKQDWFRLDWDNALNPNVTMDYADFGGRYNTFLVDPSAHQWYLKWCRIWWSEDITTEYDFWTQDLEDKVAALDLGIPSNVMALNAYLQECIWDPINLLFYPYQHQPAKYVESGLLRSLVICMDVADGISVDSLRWITNAEMQKAHLEELYPFIEWDVQIDFLDVDSNPLWNTTFWMDSYVDSDNTTIVDGGSMFDTIYDIMRPQYVDVESENIEVFGVVFIKKQMEMQIDGHPYTGLGGRGLTVIWKSWERYYRPDGVTPKDGISAVQLHETMHAIGFLHTWEPEHYAGDFSFSPMGYFAYHNGTATFDKNWVQSTYLDQMKAILWDEFTTAQAGLGTNERPETYSAEQKALSLFAVADNLYDAMNWIDSFEALSNARDWVKRMIWSSQDNTAPVISPWGIIPNISTAGFQVQAQVNDNLAGVENVTVFVQADNYEITEYPCTYSNLEWRTSVPALTASTRIEVWIEAWDWGMNRGESTHAVLILDGTNDLSGSELFLILTIVGGIAVVIIVVIVIIKRRQ